MEQQEIDRARRRAHRREAVRLADLSTIGLVFPVATALGYLGGRVIGGWLGNAATGALIGGAVGIVAGFYNLLKVARRLAREDESAGSEIDARSGHDDSDSNSDPDPSPPVAAAEPGRDREGRVGS